MHSHNQHFSIYYIFPRHRHAGCAGENACSFFATLNLLFGATLFMFAPASLSLAGLPHPSSLCSLVLSNIPFKVNSNHSQLTVAIFQLSSA